MNILAIIQVITSGLIAISAIILIIKYKRNKNLALLAASIPRFYVALATILAFISLGFPVIYIHIGVMFIFGVDIFLNFIQQKQRIYESQIEFERQIKVMTRLGSRFLIAIENLQAGFYIIDAEGNFEYINPQFCKMVGYTRRELKNMTIYDVIVDNEVELTRHKIEAKINGDSSITHSRLAIVTKGGETFLVNDVSTRTENGHPTITGTFTKVEDLPDAFNR